MTEISPRRHLTVAEKAKLSPAELIAEVNAELDDYMERMFPGGKPRKRSLFERMFLKQ